LFTIVVVLVIQRKVKKLQTLLYMEVSDGGGKCWPLILAHVMFAVFNRTSCLPFHVSAVYCCYYFPNTTITLNGMIYNQRMEMMLNNCTFFYDVRLFTKMLLIDL
jgi:hypothetical protein